MDLTFSEREAAFRDELRGWLEENPPDAKPENGSEAALSEWRRAWQRRRVVTETPTELLPAPAAG